jgi:hypothetical protein
MPTMVRRRVRHGDGPGAADWDRWDDSRSGIVLARRQRCIFLPEVGSLSTPLFILYSALLRIARAVQFAAH